MTAKSREIERAEGTPGFGRDKELERDRGTERPAKAELDASERKADERPVIHYAPDPDEEPPPRG